MWIEHRLRMAEKQAAGLQNFYLAGMEMRSVGKGDKARKMELAAKYKLSPERLGVAKRFAEQYSEKEFAEYSSYRKPCGNVLHAGYIPSFLTLKWQTESDKQLRAALQREAAENGWTADELREIIRSRFPKPASKAGRKSKDVPVALLIERTIVAVCDLIARLQCSDHLDPRLNARLQKLRLEMCELDSAMPSEKKAA